MAKLQVQTKSVSRKVVETVSFIEHPDGVVAFEIHVKTGGRKTHLQQTGFVNVKDLRTRTPGGFRAAHDKKHKSNRHKWFFVSDFDLLVLLKEFGRPPEDFAHTKFEKKSSPMADIQRPSFKAENLFCFDYYTHLLYRWGMDTPMSRVYHFDYIGGICNDSYNLKVVEKILREHPWVSDVECVEIPYFNCEVGHTESIEFSVQLPQKEHDRLVRYWRDRKKEENWSPSVKDSIIYRDWHKGKYADVLGLKKAWIGKGD